jgi:predicted ATP-dependent serine protease
MPARLQCFEGDSGDYYHIFRAIKNRFGAVNELTAVHRLSQVLDKISEEFWLPSTGSTNDPDVQCPWLNVLYAA